MRECSMTSGTSPYIALLSMIAVLSCGAAHAGPDTEISVGFPGGDTLYADGRERMMMVDVTVRNYDPSDGHYAVTVTHDGAVVHRTGLALADRPDDTWVGKYQYTVGSGPHDSLGRYDVRVTTEFGTSMGAGTFYFLGTVPEAGPASPASAGPDLRPGGDTQWPDIPGMPAMQLSVADYERIILLGIIAVAVIIAVAAVARSRRGRGDRESPYSYPYRRSEGGAYHPPAPQRHRRQAARPQPGSTAQTPVRGAMPAGFKAAGQPREKSQPSAPATSGLTGKEIIILDTSAVNNAMQTRLGIQEDRWQYRRASDYLYGHLDRVHITKSGSREGIWGRLRPEYIEKFKERECRIPHGDYSAHQKRLNAALDGLSDDEVEEWIRRKIWSLQKRCSEGKGTRELRDSLSGVDLDVESERTDAENRILDGGLVSAARDVLADDARKRDTSIAAQAVAIAGSDDAVFVSNDYDHHTLLAPAMRDLAPNMRVISLKDFDGMC